MAAQPAALAQPAEILVSGTVKDLPVRHMKIRHGSTSGCHLLCCRALRVRELDALLALRTRSERA